MEYLETFTFDHADGVTREWHLWAFVDVEDGEVTAIAIGRGGVGICTEQIRAQDCHCSLHKKALRTAQNRVDEAYQENNVIDFNDWN